MAGGRGRQEVATPATIGVPTCRSTKRSLRAARPNLPPDGESWWGTRPLSDVVWPSAIWESVVETKPLANNPGAPYPTSAPNQKGNISSPA